MIRIQSIWKYILMAIVTLLGFSCHKEDPEPNPNDSILMYGSPVTNFVSQQEVNTTPTDTPHIEATISDNLNK